ncbi:hypothetical protein BC332_33568 [Capsicum chinense]|nr:hypothetical protein BC332_33568 [Capsicum chinense]
MNEYTIILTYKKRKGWFLTLLGEVNAQRLLVSACEHWDHVRNVSSVVPARGAKAMSERSWFRHVQEAPPPSISDEVWRLEKIGKDGTPHRCLSKERVNTVKDFLTLSRSYKASELTKMTVTMLGIFSNVCDSLASLLSSFTRILDAC